MVDQNQILLKKQLDKVVPKHRIVLKENDITIELLEEASLIMAEIVKQYGDLYIPIFVRILDEIETRKNNKSYKEIALQMLSERQ